MIRRLVPLVLVFIASAALAQTETPADLSVAIVADATVDANQRITFQVDVTNNGPGVAQGVQVYGTSDVTQSGGCNGTFPTLGGTMEPGSHALVPCTTSAPRTDRDVVLTARAVSGTSDPNPANNVATRTVHAVAAPDLSIALYAPSVVAPAVGFAVGVSYANNSLTVGETGVTVTLGLPSGVQVVSMPQNCTQSAGVVTCQIGTVPANTLTVFPEPDFEITVVAVKASGARLLQFTGDIKGNEPEPVISNNHAVATVAVSRTFYVTDTADSLADAIDEANLACTDNFPCTIAFQLGTPPASGYFTLKPHRALPKITGKNILIDGSTQTRLTGDTNPDGPEIFIDGSENPWEDAIVFDEPCGGELAFVAIGNFRNAAVSMLGGPYGVTDPCGAGNFPGGAYVHDNYLGVDPTGTHAAPNGRGVVISERLIGGGVVNNLISGNHRSGVWIGLAFQPLVYSNTIGIDIHHQPLPNGASGVFAGPLVTDLGIQNNYIAFNHDFGIAIDRRAVGVNMIANSIFANLQPGIDIGLDGPTPDRDIPAPVIVSAQYDPAQNKTIVVVSAHEPVVGDPPDLALYANDAPHPSGYGDGQYYLGRQQFDAKSGGLTMSVDGDWRGKWVAATVTRNDFNFGAGHATTSEFSRAVKVE